MRTIYHELTKAEQALVALAPDLDKKPFNERTPRDGEIANLLSGVRGLIDCLTQGVEIESPEEEVEEIRSRVEFLEQHPDHAGKHEAFKPTQ